MFGFEGQYAYIGFDAPPKTADFNVWRPINLKPVGQPLPVIRFEVSLQIADSSAAARTSMTSGGACTTRPINGCSVWISTTRTLG